METHIMLIVLAAAFFHALWNATVKAGEDKLLAFTAILIICFIIVLPLVPFVGLPHPSSVPYLLASVAFHFGGYFCIVHSYRYGDFAQVYPVGRGTAPILVTLFGVFVLHEKLSAIELLALCGVIGGIMIFATRRLGTAVLHQRKSLSSALIASCFIAAYTLSDGIGVRLSGNVSGYIVWLLLLDWIPLTLYALYARPFAEIVAFTAHWRTSLFASVLGLSAYWIVIWAMSQASIPLVAAIRETSIIIAALIGAYYFKEPAGLRRIIASVVIFASLALLALSD